MSKTYDEYMWEKERMEVGAGCSDDFIEGMVAAYKHTTEWAKQNGIDLNTTPEPHRHRIHKIAAALNHLSHTPIYGRPSEEDTFMVAKLLVFAEDDFIKFSRHGLNEWRRHVRQRVQQEAKERRRWFNSRRAEQLARSTNQED